MNTDNSLTVGGRYQIIEELGHGSYGKTYLAKDLHLPENPTFVVKKFAPLDPTFAQIARLLYPEAQIYAQGFEEISKIGKVIGKFYQLAPVQTQVIQIPPQLRLVQPIL